MKYLLPITILGTVLLCLFLAWLGVVSRDQILEECLTKTCTYPTQPYYNISDGLCLCAEIPK